MRLGVIAGRRPLAGAVIRLPFPAYRINTVERTREAREWLGRRVGRGSGAGGAVWQEGSRAGEQEGQEAGKRKVWIAASPASRGQAGPRPKLERLVPNLAELSNPQDNRVPGPRAGVHLLLHTLCATPHSRSGLQGRRSLCEARSPDGLNIKIKSWIPGVAVLPRNDDGEGVSRGHLCCSLPAFSRRMPGSRAEED